MKEHMRGLTDAQINSIVYLSNQGKITKIKEAIHNLRNDSSVTKKDALKRIKAIVDEKNDTIWEEASKGTLQKVKSSEIKKIDMEKVKANLDAIINYCINNSTDTYVSKNKALDAIKGICNDLRKNIWEKI